MGKMRNSIMRRGAAVLLMLTVAFSCADISAQAGIAPKETGTVIAQGNLEKDPYMQEAFEYCENLKSVFIPDSVTSIGISAFYGCKSLADVAIPEKVTSIGDSAFAECASLISISIPDSVSFLSQHVFRDCTNLKRAELTSVGMEMFKGCANLKEVILREGCRNIGYGAFRNCAALETITLPDGIQAIGAYAFYGCSSLGSINIPASVERLANGLGSGLDEPPFMGCTALSDIAVSPQNTHYCFENGILYGKDKTVLLEYPQNREGDSFTVPDGVQTIEQLSFSKCKNLKHIVFPQSVDEINGQAFSYTKLSSIAVYNADCWIDDAAYGYVFPENGDTENEYTDDIIYGHPGSTAEKLAQMYGKTFKQLSELTQKPGQNPDQTNPDQTKPDQNNPKPDQTNSGQTYSGQETKESLAAGKKITDRKSSGKYKVTSKSSSSPAVAYVGTSNARTNSVIVPDSITYQGVTYKVTSIDAKALKGKGQAKSVKITK